MTLAISSARPQTLFNYARVGQWIDFELAQEANRLAAVLHHFEATCREPGMAMRVSYLADELSSYVRWAMPVDDWVRQVGQDFWMADRARWRSFMWRGLGVALDLYVKLTDYMVNHAEMFVGAVFVLSLRGSASAPRVSLSWVRFFHLKPQTVREFLNITPKTLNIENVIKYWDKATKGIIILVIAIKWLRDFQKYSGEQLVRALVVDAVLVAVGAEIAMGVGALFAGFLAGVSWPAFIMGLLAVGAAILVAKLWDNVTSGLRERIIELGFVEGTLQTVQAAVEWTQDKVSDAVEWGKQTVKTLDEHVFSPIAKTIAQGVDTVHNWVDAAARRLRQKFEEAKEAAGRVIFDRAIRPTDGPALEVRNALHDAMDGWGTDEQKIFDILENASDEEKKAVLRDQALMSRLERELGRKDMLKVLALLGAPIKMQLERAMAGFGTDEDAIYDILKHASNEEIISVRSDAALMEALKKELTDKELIIVLKLLYPGQPIPDIEDVRKNNVSLEVMESKLFVRGVGDNADISDNDVAQGMLGDCYLVAAMGEIAHQNPERIRQMIHDNGDGTYDVILFDEVQKKFVTVTVDNMFPTHGGRPFYVQGGDQRELWPMIIEKAYAKYFGNENYGNIEGGWPSIAMERLTGGKTTVYNGGSVSNFPLSIEDFGAHFSAGDAIAVGNVGGKVNHPDIVNKHAYYVVGVNVDNKTVTVQNPWGRKYPPITMSWEQFVQTFEKISITDLSGAQISTPSP